MAIKLFLKKSTGEILCEDHKSRGAMELSESDVALLLSTWQEEMHKLGLEDEYKSLGVWDAGIDCMACDDFITR